MVNDENNVKRCSIRVLIWPDNAKVISVELVPKWAEMPRVYLDERSESRYARGGSKQRA